MAIPITHSLTQGTNTHTVRERHTPTCVMTKRFPPCPGVCLAWCLSVCPGVCLAWCQYGNKKMYALTVSRSG
ncbi:hypothetical protein J4Q44_G00323650 [Coregonus suidteri]|uniref:Uncharacterized protein n=1 Tax=Coregonus suidteri TaxID=861788 RepID=A0AAN8KS54_9TELE